MISAESGLFWRFICWITSLQFMKVKTYHFTCSDISSNPAVFKVARVWIKLCVNVRGSRIFCCCNFAEGQQSAGTTNFYSEMSWFNQVNQGSHPQQPAEIQSFVPSNSTCNPPNGPGVFYTLTSGAGLSTSPSPSPSYDFPSAPRAGASPLRLENLSCAAQSSDHVQDPPEPISYVTLQEQRCVLSWFQGWSSSQRERFLQDLLGKAVPGKVCTLLDSLSTLQVLAPLKNRCNFVCVCVIFAALNPFLWFSNRFRISCQTSLNASCASGPSGLSHGERRRGITFCTCWRSTTQLLSPSFTKVLLAQQEETELCLKKKLFHINFPPVNLLQFVQLKQFFTEISTLSENLHSKVYFFDE